MRKLLNVRPQPHAGPVFVNRDVFSQNWLKLCIYRLQVIRDL